MRIGPLRDRFVFQKKQNSSQNSYGENTAGYDKDFTVWGALDDIGSLSGRKLLVAQQILAEGDHLVRTRYRDGLTARKRIKTVVGSRIFDIQSVVNIDSANRELWFRCKETNPTP